MFVGPEASSPHPVPQRPSPLPGTFPSSPSDSSSPTDGLVRRRVTWTPPVPYSSTSSSTHLSHMDPVRTSALPPRPRSLSPPTTSLHSDLPDPDHETYFGPVTFLLYTIVTRFLRFG